jgi:hypothetical protein
VGRQIKRVLEEVYASAQDALESSLAERTLADALENIEDAPPRLRRIVRRSRKTA